MSRADDDRCHALCSISGGPLAGGVDGGPAKYGTVWLTAREHQPCCRDRTGAVTWRAADFTSRAFSAARQTIIPVRQGNRLKLLPDLPALMFGSTLPLHIDSNYTDGSKQKAPLHARLSCTSELKSRVAMRIFHLPPPVQSSVRSSWNSDTGYGPVKIN